MVKCGECGAILTQFNPAISPDTTHKFSCPRCEATTFIGPLSCTLSIRPLLNGSLSLESVEHVAKLPALLLNALVTLGSRVEDGHRILAVEPVWTQIARLVAADPNALYQIPPEKMEHMIAGWYAEQGFNVTLTPRSGDHGRDVIAEKPGVLSVRIIDQVKAYKPGHLVDANDVRALLGVLGSDRATSKGLVTTTSDFAPKIDTDPFIAPYMPYRLELVNGAELVRRLDAASQGK